MELIIEPKFLRNETILSLTLSNLYLYGLTIKSMVICVQWNKSSK